MKWTPKDVVALVMIVGAFGLRFVGINHITEWIIIGVGGGYLGLGIPATIREHYPPKGGSPP